MKTKPEAKTKLRLRNALNELMETHRFQEISVNDICSQAYVGRSTFYEHFQDKYDLLSYTLSVFSQEFTRNLENEPLRYKLEMMLSMIKEQAHMFKQLLSSDLNHEVMQILRMVWRDTIESKVQGETKSDSFTVRFASGGFVFVIIDWIESGYSTPIETLAQSIEYTFVLLNLV